MPVLTVPTLKTGENIAVRFEVPNNAGDAIRVLFDADKKYVVAHCGFAADGSPSVLADMIKVDLLGLDAEPNKTEFGGEYDTKILQVGDAVYPRRGTQGITVGTMDGFAQLPVIEVRVIERNVAGHEG